MGTTKTEDYLPDQLSMAAIFKALAHPARIAIIEFLLTTKQCYCGDIVQELPLSQATVSQHLKALKTAGIIQGTIDGNAVCYCLAPHHFLTINVYISRFQKIDCPTDATCK